MKIIKEKGSTIGTIMEKNNEKVNRDTAIEFL